MGNGYEYIFVSGICKFPDINDNRRIPVKSHNAQYEQNEIPEYFIESHSPGAAPLPYKFIMRNYIDTERLYKNVSFRYSEDAFSSSFLKKW